MKKALQPVYNIVDYCKYDKHLSYKGGVSQVLKGLLIPYILLTLLVTMLSVIFMRYIEIGFWRHDSMQYLLNLDWYEINLKEEGRWINYVLFYLLKTIPGHIAAIANLGLLYLFVLLITRGVIEDRMSRWIFGLSCLMIPVFHAQNMWPNITFGSLVFLPIVYFMARRLPPFVVFAISAIYYFGTLSNVYFLVPLVFLADLKKSLTGQFKNDFLAYLRILVPFALCYILGFLVSNGIVLAITGETIKLSEWRKPTPADSLDQLLTNFMAVSNRIWVIVVKLWSTVPIVLWYLLIPIFLLAINKKTIWIVALLLTVFLAAFYTTTYHGIMISERTLWTSVLAGVLLIGIVPAMRFKANIAHLTLCVALISPFYYDSSDQLKLFGKISNYYKKQLTHISQQLSSAPKADIQILMFVSDDEVKKINRQIEQHYNLTFKWCENLETVMRTIRTGLRSLGYFYVVWVNDDSAIQNVKNQIKGQPHEESIVLLILNQPPGSFGIVFTDDKVDYESLD